MAAKIENICCHIVVQMFPTKYLLLLYSILYNFTLLSSSLVLFPHCSHPCGVVAPAPS